MTITSYFIPNGISLYYQLKQSISDSIYLSIHTASSPRGDYVLRDVGWYFFFITGDHDGPGVDF